MMMKTVKITCTNSSVQCTSMCNDSDFCPPGCHFLYIFASKESHKNKGQVSQIFGQSVTNDMSTPG